MNKPLKITLICISVFVALLLLAVVAFILIIEPNFTLFDKNKLDLDKLTAHSKSVILLDAFDNPIEDALFGSNKISVKISDLPDYTVNAFVAIEDKRFYSHHGADYFRMASALTSNIKSGGFSQGASTITQQLIKNTHLSNEKTLKRKISEIRLARKLERVWSKNQILESYFNVLYFGSGIRGLGTASRVMFDKPASELTLAQSAALASIINNPAKYNPYSNIENLNKRKMLVLNQMLSQRLIKQSEYDNAVKEKLEFGKNKYNQFITGAIKDACAALNCSEKELYLHKYTIKTDYNPQLTEAARAAIGKIDSDFTIRVLVLDNKTGGIVCDETNVNKYINPMRSPASTIKPFVSYAVALEKGLNPLSQIADEPTVFGDYKPANYKNVYRGYLSLKDSLKFSSNIAAVKLMRQFGVDSAKSVAKNFGITFAQSDDTLAIALGGMEKGLTLPQIANAYRTLANSGVYSPINYIKSVNDTDNKPIYSSDFTAKKAVGDDTAYLITDMLMECAQSGTAKKLNNIGYIAAKTGTNGDETGNYDCYGIAYNPQYTIAVWYGAAENPIPNSITGASCCNIIKNLCASKEIDTTVNFEMPQSVAYFDVDLRQINETHEVFLADPLLQKRYRMSALLSKRHLPVRKNIDLLDYYDSFMW